MTKLDDLTDEKAEEKVDNKIGVHALRVCGARVHNLKNIDVVIPRHQLTVITGVSGSGKSSLAFDTIYAEGQRRYVESLSVYARQFLEVMGKPDVEAIEGLSPAISIEQKTASKNPRSTVGTVTEVYDYMRLLWARVGTPYSPATGLPIEAQTVSQMVDKVLALPEGTRLMLLSPFIRDKKGEYRKELADLQSRGFTRVRLDGVLYDIADVPQRRRNARHTLEVVVDRVIIKPGLETRLADSLETALALSDGIVYCEEVLREGEGKKEPLHLIFSSRFSCPVSGFVLEEIEPRLFSFNAPQGACPTCSGIGVERYFNPDFIIPNKTLSLAQGAIAPWRGEESALFTQTLESLARHFGIDMQTAWCDLPHTVQHGILYGVEDKITFRYLRDGKEQKIERSFDGVIRSLTKRLAMTESPRTREDLLRYQSEEPCHACHGARLKPEALSVRVHHKTIAEAADFTVAEALLWFNTIVSAFLTTKSYQKAEIAQRIVREIIDRLQFLDDVGLGYLTLSRSSATLSGGESQRIRLASQIGSGLTGVLYVLDEPSIGLHQRDNERLLGTLFRLRALGNTLIVVEHDEETMRKADWLIDMGPGAGVHGGQVVAAGTPDAVAQNPQSMTGAYLSGRKHIEVPKTRRVGMPPIGTQLVGQGVKESSDQQEQQKERVLVLEGASGHNLQNVTAHFPLGAFICVTGVSGSGKSTLVIDTLYAALARQLMGTSITPEPYRQIKGIEWLDKVIEIDQSPIGRTPRSNPATYTDLLTPIREWFAELPESRVRGYKAGRFSFNVKGGRCEACQGDGIKKIEMHFLPDMFVTCDQCKGARYNRETLEIRFRGKTIADVLAMSVDEAYLFFATQPSIRHKLAVLQQVGLGYIALGQQATTLSGGEAQRVKLSRELARRATGRTFYILDEPTTGLHTEDIRKLLTVLHALVESGNTVVVIEHNLDVIKTADWVIDIGPEGGSGGGRIVCEGTPEAVAACPQSHTGRFLAPLLTV
ncbi:MAG: excinuclease ABC subunit UvrA [Acetobacter sp.]|nr:excinuclease ABC subunit UvrA [Acetobacter sp.]